jgi:hypothetical protein
MNEEAASWILFMVQKTEKQGVDSTFIVAFIIYA